MFLGEEHVDTDVLNSLIKFLNHVITIERKKIAHGVVKANINELIFGLFLKLLFLLSYLKERIRDPFSLAELH